ncbi:MAG: IS200/IS605 family transposase [Paludibacteraceae bacterium]|nr:IS200/IS605 family transposase [Paludibacteraceae bacterium]
MAYTNLLYHIVFRPKNSESVITIAYEDVLYRYIWGYVTNKKGTLLRIGGMPDHIHMLVSLPPSIAISNFVHDLKLATNIFLLEHKEEFPKFKGWAKSYCALTYSKNEKDMIVNYIRNQKEHHQKVSFKDELVALVKEMGVVGDLKYFFVD